MPDISQEQLDAFTSRLAALEAAKTETEEALAQERARNSSLSLTVHEQKVEKKLGALQRMGLPAGVLAKMRDVLAPSDGGPVLELTLDQEGTQVKKEVDMFGVLDHIVSGFELEENGRIKMELGMQVDPNREGDGGPAGGKPADGGEIVFGETNLSLEQIESAADEAAKWLELDAAGVTIGGAADPEA